MSKTIKPVVMFAGIARNFTAKKGETAKLDVNGKPPMVIESIAGEAPRSVNLVSGTVAEGQGLEAGKSYTFKAVHTGMVESTANPGQMTEGFNISSIGEITPKESREWYREEGLSFLIDPQVDNAQPSNAGDASQPMEQGDVTKRENRNVRENVQADA